LPLLRDRLLASDVEPDQVLLVRDQLGGHGQALAAGLWDRVERGGPDERFRALVALARFDPDSQRWRKHARSAGGAPPAPGPPPPGGLGARPPAPPRAPLGPRGAAVPRR